MRQAGTRQSGGALPAEGVDESRLPRPTVQISQREGRITQKIPTGIYLLLK